MNWSILAITGATRREFCPSDDKEYDRTILSLTRDEKYVVIQDVDTRNNEKLLPLRSAILTKRVRNAKEEDLS